MSIRFAYDENKSKLNKKKRGVDFEEAKSAIKNEICGGILNDYPEQYYSVGFSSNGKLITVVYEFKKDKDGFYIRIVTLWKTTKEERAGI